MKVFLSIAVRTGVWSLAGSRDTQEGRSPEGGQFSSVKLSGASSSASLVGLENRSELLTEIAQALIDAGVARCSPRSATLRKRDIDGSTLLVEIDVDTDIVWDDVAAMSDAMVKWADDSRLFDLNKIRPGSAHGETTYGEFGGDVAPSALWSHLILACDGGTTPVTTPRHRCDAEAAAKLLPTSFTTVEQKTSSVYLAFHASLVCSADADATRRIVDLVDELHGWWTSSWTLDQALLGTCIRTAGTLKSNVLLEIREDVDSLASTTAAVGTIRSRLDTFRLSLGGLEWPIWDAATDKWELEDNITSLERKRQLLVDMTNSYRDILESHRSVRLNQAAAFFAVMSSLASLIAVLIFLFPTLQASDENLLVRSALTCVAFFVTLTGVFWSSKYMLRVTQLRRSERRRPAEIMGL